MATLAFDKTQECKILWLLQAAWPAWTPAPELAQISLQYGRVIHSLRGEGWLIKNRIRVVDGRRHGEFRLGSAGVPSSLELRHSHVPITRQPSLFPVSHVDDG